jgi:hypothetical protein
MLGYYVSRVSQWLSQTPTAIQGKNAGFKCKLDHQQLTDDVNDSQEHPVCVHIDQELYLTKNLLLPLSNSGQETTPPENIWQIIVRNTKQKSLASRQYKNKMK